MHGLDLLTKTPLCVGGGGACSPLNLSRFPSRAPTVKVVNHLVSLVNRPDAKDEDSLLVTENAVAAIGTLCVSPALAAAVDRSQLLPMWLANLPLREVRSV